MSLHNLSQGQMQQTGRPALVGYTKLKSEPISTKNWVLVLSCRTRTAKYNGGSIQFLPQRSSETLLLTDPVAESNRRCTMSEHVQSNWPRQTAACAQPRKLGARPKCYHSITRPTPASEVFILMLALRGAATASTPGRTKRTRAVSMRHVRVSPLAWQR